MEKLIEKMNEFETAVELLKKQVVSIQADINNGVSCKSLLEDYERALNEFEKVHTKWLDVKASVRYNVACYINTFDV